MAVPKTLKPISKGKAMAQEVLDGHAIAVHFTEDEIALGEVPTLYKRSRGGIDNGCRTDTEEKD